MVPHENSTESNEIISLNPVLFQNSGNQVIKVITERDTSDILCVLCDGGIRQRTKRAQEGVDYFELLPLLAAN